MSLRSRAAATIGSGMAGQAVGGIAVKSYNQQRRVVRQMIIKAARERKQLYVRRKRGR